MAAASFITSLVTRLLRSAQSGRLHQRPFHLSAVRNEAVVISGRKLAEQIKQEVRQEVEEWVASGNKRPHLSVVLVGENPASQSYVLNKTRAAASVGINSETILKPASISEEELLNLINKLNNDDNVDGLLVQLPLPEHIDERKVCNAVSPDKDVDGFHVINVGRMCLDQCSMLPATPWGVWEIIKRTGIPTLGKNVVVAGRSKNVGMPIAMLLHTDGAHERPGGDATVTISHRYTPKEELKKHTALADIVISAAGIPNLITADMIKEGAAVIDVGINRIQDPITAKPKLVGDVDFEACGIFVPCECSVAQSCLTLCNLINDSPPVSSLHGIFLAGTPEWVAVSSSRGSSDPEIELKSPVLPALQADSLPLSHRGSP